MTEIYLMIEQPQNQSFDILIEAHMMRVYPTKLEPINFQTYL